SLSDARLAELVRDLEQIEHLRFLRIHTRQPVIVPSRVNCDLIQWLTTTRLKINIVLHINHPQEIDTQVEKAIQILKSHQIDLLNQSVLLKGVNDNPETLIDLSQTLGALGIIPYYLHLLDKVQGARHFDCDENTGRAIIEEMKYNLPGFLVPRLVKEVSGEGSKQTVY
ncbi:MAG: EF-P beta-lysylation protein EpmB, partial [Gammaproteobacteria bacterium]|nr:EF-P beta-lysylation protein EpmB [Gammaproteobacteria bacterium]